jgi:hypothetical protein
MFNNDIKLPNGPANRIRLTGFDVSLRTTLRNRRHLRGAFDDEVWCGFSGTWELKATVICLFVVDIYIDIENFQKKMLSAVFCSKWWEQTDCIPPQGSQRISLSTCWGFRRA